MIRNVDTSPYPMGGMNPNLLNGRWIDEENLVFTIAFARNATLPTARQAHASRLASS